MQQPRESFSVRTPAEIGTGVERASRGVLEAVGPGMRQQAAEDAPDRDVLDRQRWFARAAPHGLIGIRKQRIHDVAEPRAGVTPVFVVELFQSDVSGVSHVSPPAATIPL